MEKIRQALDRAQRERAALHPLPADEVADTPAPRSGPRPFAAADHEPVTGRPAAPIALRPAREFAPPAAQLEQSRLVAGDASHPAAAAFQMLRTQVLQRMRSHDWRLLGVASARARDGKTTLAGNLAIAVASDPRHTALLVDLDLRRPRVASAFGASVEHGIDDVLRGEAAPDACFLRPSGVPGLALLPARAGCADSSRLLAAAPCHALLAELKARYVNRVVIVDMPPVLEADEALTLAPLLDAVLFVVAEGRTARDDVARSLHLLRATPVIGTVLNRSIEAIRSEAYG